MTRKQFIEQYGATCSNWTFSWSFINQAENFIIFGAWDAFTNGKLELILSEDWQTNSRGKKNKGYNQSREHVRLIEEEGYRLMTFPMEHTENEEGIAKIKGFTPVLTEKALIRIENAWYASEPDAFDTSPLAEEISEKKKYYEGARSNVTINAYERNPQARRDCTRHHGCKCIVCEFDFSFVYGDLGKGYIHVHHLIPVSQISQEYEIDPIKDLIPVCPNCHAMLHRTDPPLTINGLRNHIHSVERQG